ncbi:MAG: AcvB/VirJ family lysyl-phosphatidylglycerol hydrolase [Steroidobacteraceae bacterium]
MRDRRGGKMNLAHVVLLALVAGAFTVSCSRTAIQVLAHGRFKSVTVYHPAGNVQQVVLFLSGDGGWQADTDRMAKVLQAHGALVLGLDEPALLASFTQEHSACFFADGDLENLSHYVQAYYRLPTYITPVLAGYSAGATLAYATAAQAPPGLFAGVLTLGFTPDYETTKPFCKGEGVHFQRRPDSKGLTLLPDPKLALRWVDVHGVIDSVCPAAAAAAFIHGIHNARISLIPGVEHDFADPRQWSTQLGAALDGVTDGSRTAQVTAPPSLKDLPLTEVPATATGNDDLFAVLLSGDGGWAGLDREVARALSGRGIPVVGWDTLRYFWTARTPDGLAHDLDRTLDYYATAWHRQRALLIGYSQGADVLPFAVNRLPDTARSRIATTTLLGLGRNAAFEFHLSNWVGPAAGLPILPEYQKLSSATTLCVYGAGDKDSLCTDLPSGTPGTAELSGGHHFDGDYDGLARLVLKFAGRNP